VDIWQTYQKLGIWGLWLDYFGAVGGLEVVWRWPGVEYSLLANGEAAKGRAPTSLKQVFFWQSPHDFEIELFASRPIESAEQDIWSLLLQMESRHPVGHPTFLPVLPVAVGASATLNEVITDQPGSHFFGGQPGCGKAAALQCVTLWHAGALPRRSAVMEKVKFSSGEAIIVPEVALLEIDEQQEVASFVKNGGKIWAASAYDLDLMKSRKIIKAQLADILSAVKVLLPSVSKREEAELKEIEGFWRAFYGEALVDSGANLDYQRRQTLEPVALSVEAILEEGRGLRGVVAEFEREAIRKAHARVGRSQHKIANLLKVSRGSLQHKLRKYGLESYAPQDADTDNGG